MTNHMTIESIGAIARITIAMTDQTSGTKSICNTTASSVLKGGLQHSQQSRAGCGMQVHFVVNNLSMSNLETESKALQGMLQHSY